jgi:hypothetical protein
MYSLVPSGVLPYGDHVVLKQFLQWNLLAEISIVLISAFDPAQ